MRNLKRYRRELTVADDGQVLWLIDTPEKRLLLAILEQAILDLYSYVKHGIIVTRFDGRQFKSAKKSKPTTELSEDLIEWLYDESIHKFSLCWILEHISTDIDRAKEVVYRARDQIQARKFDCALFLNDFFKMV